MKKRLMALLLAIAMLLSVTPVAVFATGETEKNTISYVSLGASQTNGYALRGYVQGDMDKAALDQSIKDKANVLGYLSETPGSYPVLIADHFRYDLDQLAISSMRVEELRVLLDNNYYGDAYTGWRFIKPDGTGWFNIAGGVDGLRQQYQAYIADADLITVDIGANNFGVYISYQLGSNFSLDKDIAALDPALAGDWAKAKAFVADVMAKVAPDMASSLGQVDGLLDTFAYALVGYCVNFDAVMERIYTLNPDAQVVVISIQNMMDGLYANIPGVDVTVPLGDIFAAVVNAANVYIATSSPYADKYLFADVRKDGRVEYFIDTMVAYDGNPHSLDQNTIDCFNVYDGNPGVSYDNGVHIKWQVHKYLEANWAGLAPAAVQIPHVYRVL